MLKICITGSENVCRTYGRHNFNCMDNFVKCYNQKVKVGSRVRGGQSKRIPSHEFVRFHVHDAEEINEY